LLLLSKLRAYSALVFAFVGEYGPAWLQCSFDDVYDAAAHVGQNNTQQQQTQTFLPIAFALYFSLSVPYPVCCLQTSAGLPGWSTALTTWTTQQHMWDKTKPRNSKPRRFFAFCVYPLAALFLTLLLVGEYGPAWLEYSFDDVNAAAESYKAAISFDPQTCAHPACQRSACY
jgi:hypothetical protein